MSMALTETTPFKKVTDIMIKYEHKTTHLVVSVGLKGNPEGRIEACIWQLRTLKESNRAGVEFCDYRKNVIKKELTKQTLYLRS
jgi:hypothetical protein